MKTMKRFVAVMMVVAMMLALCACGKNMSDSKYCGMWKATTAEMSGIQIDVEEYLGSVTLDLKDNGKVDFDFAGDSASGKWEETSDGVTIDNGDLVLTEQDGTLVMDYEGVVLVFEKQ